MRTRLLPLLLLMLPALLLVSCGDDDAGASAPEATVASADTPAAESKSEAAIKGSVHIDFTGAPQEMKSIQADFEVAPGSTAWEAVKMALGEENVASQDFGGDLGIFISAFKGVKAEGNHFWEFKINGEPAGVGVGKYEVQQGDVLEFVYSSF